MRMYSTVNIAVVIRDLSRLPRGDALAADLLHAFALDRAGLAALDRTTPLPAPVAAERQRLLAVAAARPRALEVMAGARVAAAERGMDAWLSSLGLLESAPMGDFADLAGWVRSDVLVEAWDRVDDVAVARHPHALDVVCDALLAQWNGDVDAGVAAALAAPWREWTAANAAAEVDAPALAELLTMLSGAGPARLAAAGAAMAEARGGGWSWPVAMHDTCWAVELTGRGRSAAVAQLHALRAVLRKSAQAPRPDVVAAVTAAVHATAVADVLPTETVTAMCQPLLANLD